MSPPTFSSASSHAVVVLADASKVGEENVERFATLDPVDVLVTDDSLSPDDHGDLQRWASAVSCVSVSGRPDAGL